jgi:hypothetical protein
MSSSGGRSQPQRWQPQEKHRQTQPQQGSGFASTRYVMVYRLDKKRRTITKKSNNDRNHITVVLYTQQSTSHRLVVPLHTPNERRGYPDNDRSQKSHHRTHNNQPLILDSSSLSHTPHTPRTTGDTQTRSTPVGAGRQGVMGAVGATGAAVGQQGQSERRGQSE